MEIVVGPAGYGSYHKHSIGSEAGHRDPLVRGLPARIHLHRSNHSTTTHGWASLLGFSLVLLRQIYSCNLLVFFGLCHPTPNRSHIDGVRVLTEWIAWVSGPQKEKGSRVGWDASEVCDWSTVAIKLLTRDCATRPCTLRKIAIFCNRKRMEIKDEQRSESREQRAECRKRITVSRDGVDGTRPRTTHSRVSAHLFHEA